MKKTLVLLAFLAPVVLGAQELVLVTYTPFYKEMSFYKMTEEEGVNVVNGSWDLVFTAFGDDDAGILINEASELSGDEVEVYLAPTDDFEDPINPDNLSIRLYNNEKSWTTGGAFNSFGDQNNPIDFGWGLYDSSNGRIDGTVVFAIKLRDGSFRKLKIVSLDQGVYTVKHAKLDGSDEKTFTIDKADYADRKFAFYSLTSGQSLDAAIPAEWDILFTRYVVAFDDGNGGFLYNASNGALSGFGVEVAQVDGIDPETVEYGDYEQLLNTEIDEIGYDWKAINLATNTWVLPENRVYFVKTPDEKVWKIFFTDFGGSLAGHVLFEKTLVQGPSAAREKAPLPDLRLFPNPSHGNAHLTFSLKNGGTAHFSLSNSMGQVVWTGKTRAQAGFNAVELSGMDILPGVYFLQIQAEGMTSTLRFVRQ